MKGEKKVLLIYPPSGFGGLDVAIRTYPLGLAYLAAMVDDISDVRIIDGRVNALAIDTIVKRVIDFDPDIIGFSNITSASTNIILEIAKKVRAALPERMVVFGGHHATFAAEELLNTGLMDVIVRREGELTFREIVQGIPLPEILGISFRKGEEILHQPSRPLIEDLDSLPYPARDKVNHNQYNTFGIRAGVIETSRGCPFDCSFCGIPAFHGNRWRARSPKKIMDEIKHIQTHYQKEAIFFVDDNFTVDMERVGSICNLILESKINCNFFCQARVDSIASHPKIVEKMKRAGFWLVFLGIESPFQDFLDQIKKKILTKQIQIAVDILKKNEIAIWGAFIVGFPGQSERSILQTAEFAKELDIEIAQFTLLTPLIGSKLYNQCQQENSILSTNWSKYTLAEPVIDVGIPPRRLAELYAKCYRIFYRRLSYVPKILASRNKLIRNLLKNNWGFWLRLALLGKPY